MMMTVTDINQLSSLGFINKLAAGYFLNGSQWFRSDRKTIYSVVKAGALVSKKTSHDESIILPDEKYYNNEYISSFSNEKDQSKAAERMFVPPGFGAKEFLYYGLDSDQSLSYDLFSHLETAVSNPSASSWSALYKLMMANCPCAHSMELARKIIGNSDIDKNKLLEIARLLIKKSLDRNPVKYGIILFSAASLTASGKACSFARNCDITDDDIDLLMRIGSHEEFTFYTAFILPQILHDAQSYLLKLAESLGGWARATVIRQIIRVLDSHPEVDDNGRETAKGHKLREWILLNGANGSLRGTQIGLECAVGGGLTDALFKESLSDKLFDAICDIFVQVAQPQELTFAQTFENSQKVVIRFLSLLSGRASDLLHLQAAVNVKFFIEALLSSGVEKLASCNWTVSACEDCLGRCDEIVLRTWWFDQIIAAVRGGSDAEYARASALAEVLAIDLQSWHWAKLIAFDHSGPSPHWLHFNNIWWNVLVTANKERLKDILAYAEIVFPLERLATSSLNSFNPDEANKWFNALNGILVRLEPCPLQGWELVLTALRSPVIALRITAVETITKWNLGHIPGFIESELEERISVEEQKDLVHRLKQIMEKSL